MNNQYHNNNFQNQNYQPYRPEQGQYDPNSYYDQGYQQNFQQNFQNIGFGTLSLADYSRKVFTWMFIGLAITFAIGFSIMLNPAAAFSLILAFPAVFIGLVIAELVAVIVLGLFISKLSPTACKVIFILYSIVNGITLAPTLIYVGAGTAFFAFAVTGGIFGAMALYGWITKKDLTKLGTVLLFGLIGLLIFSLIAMFIHIPMADMLICLAGIAIFIGFTAYDTQKIKRYYYNYQGSGVLIEKTAVMAALDLYLDFINLFIYLARLFANRR